MPELAMVRGEHTLRARNLVADALDLAHRLPRTWAEVRDGEAEPWVAGRVAVLTRKLVLDDVGLVDVAVARAITGHAPSTVLEIAAAKVIEADPEAHAMERERHRRERYVTLSRSDVFGFRHVVAKVTTGDAAWVDAMVDRAADILAATYGHDHNRDELRSLAFGWLARPAELLKLLLDHARQPEGTCPVDGPVWAPDHLAEMVGRLASMSNRQLVALRGRGVALKPVIDHRISPRADAYEHPEAVKDAVWMLTGGDVFPCSTRSAARDRVDFDHATPYQSRERGGAPGQTGAHNCGPLRRSHHRWKTHAGYRVRQAGPGRHLWQIPHGLCDLVDPTGTHRLADDEADLILTAPPGVDICPARVRLEYAGP